MSVGLILKIVKRVCSFGDGEMNDDNESDDGSCCCGRWKQDGRWKGGRRMIWGDLSEVGETRDILVK